MMWVGIAVMTTMMRVRWPAIKRKRVCFPARKPISKLVNDEVITSLISSVSEDWGAEVFPKIGGGEDSKLIFYHLSVSKRSAR